MAHNGFFHDNAHDGALDRLDVPGENHATIFRRLNGSDSWIPSTIEDLVKAVHCSPASVVMIASSERMRCTYGIETRETEHDLSAAVADLRRSLISPIQLCRPNTAVSGRPTLQVRFLVSAYAVPPRREHARAVRDGPRLPQLLSDAGLLPQEAAEIRASRLALQKCPPVAQVIKDLEEEIPVQILGRAPCEDRRVALRAESSILVCVI